MSFIIGMSDEERIACDRLQMAAEKREKFIASAVSLAKAVERLTCEVSEDVSCLERDNSTFVCLTCEARTLACKVLEHQPNK